MPIANFQLSAQLDKRIKNEAEGLGFSSRAEFFRSAAIYYLNVVKKPKEWDWDSVPTYQLKGEAAKKADVMVREALKEHREGKTRRINSLADLME